MRQRTQAEWDELVAVITREGAIRLSEAAKLIPAGRRGQRGSRVSVETLRRWIVDGVSGGVRLDGAMLNADGWFTSAAAVSRFQAALSRRAVPAREAAPPRQRRPPESDPAGEELDRILAGKRR